MLRPIRDLIASAGLGGAVSAFALPGQDRLAAAYRYLAERRSVFCLTARYEPFGLAPLEAAAAGLPLVVTRNGGPSESLVEAGIEYGVLVDPIDPASVAAGLIRALGAEWDALAARGRQRVIDRYTWDRTAEGYLGAIERAIDRAGPAGAADPALVRVAGPATASGWRTWPSSTWPRRGSVPAAFRLAAPVGRPAPRPRWRRSD